MVSKTELVYHTKFRVESMRLAFLPPGFQILRIITGSNFTHFRSLLQLLESVERTESIEYVTVYDLGLRPEQRTELEARYGGLKLVTFMYEDYPPHFNILNHSGQYAWKPVIIRQELNKSDAPLLWLDAGCIVEKPLNVVRKIIKWGGFYSPVSQGSIKDWTHPEMLARLQLAPQLASKRNLSSGVVGLDPQRGLVRRLVNEWEQCAMDKECIAPDGSDKSNHRQDQSAFTVLAWKLGLASGSPAFLHGIRIHCDVD